MHIFILGMGHVGKALSTELRSAGHRVTGSTTTDSKVTELQKLADTVVVLDGKAIGKPKSRSWRFRPQSGPIRARC